LVVSRDGQITDTWNGLQHPYAAVPTGTGSILVGNGPSPGVVEFVPTGQTVWSLNHDSQLYLAGANPQVENAGFEQGSGDAPADWVAQQAQAHGHVRPLMIRDVHVHHSGQ